MPLDDWFDSEAEQEALYDLLYDELLTVYQLGSADGLLKLGKLRMTLSVDWEQINETAAAWAERYTFDLVKQLTDTTRDQLQTAISSFFRERGMTRGDLERMILQGPDGITDLVSKGRVYTAAQRAEWIAVTETSRAYNAGTVEATNATGLERKQPKEQPPKHVACRCSLSPSVRDDGTLSYVWQTVADERVCESCGPLHMQDVGE
jgi:hypothetical protein